MIHILQFQVIMYYVIFYYSGFKLSISSRDVIVANAHQDPGPEGVRLFDTGYLVAVAGFLVFTNGFPVVQFLTHGNPHLAQCRTEGANHEVQSPPLSLVQITRDTVH